jgi:S-DNA-T family DNA segregation ATPase FtsK/SpoIIIE
LAKRSRKKARKEPAVARTPGRLEAEAVALGLFAVAVFLEIALLSYHPQDPWWGFGARVANRCGPVGALVAAGLAGTFGWAAHMVPLAAALIGVRYLRGLPFRPKWVPATAWAGFWITLAGGFEALRHWLPERIPPTAGGLIGTHLVAALESAFYPAGMCLLLAVGLVLTLLIATGASMRDSIRIARRVFRGLVRELAQLVVVSWVRLRRRLEQYLAGRSARREQEQGEAAGLVPGARRTAPARSEKSGEPEVVEHRVGKPMPSRQQPLPFPQTGPRGPFRLPDLEMLAQGIEDERNVDRDFLIKNSQVLEKKLADFGVSGHVVKVHPGPVITMYEFEPAPGVKVSRITNLSDDLALALRAMAVRIVAPIPGKNVARPHFLHRGQLEADLRVGQGHLRLAGDDRPGPDAPSAGRRCHGIREVGLPSHFPV